MEKSPSFITIDCARCVMFESAHCADCVVTYLCSDEDHGDQSRETSAIVFDVAEFRAVTVLAEAGLVPTLLHRTVP